MRMIFFSMSYQKLITKMVEGSKEDGNNGYENDDV